MPSDRRLRSGFALAAIALACVLLVAGFLDATAQPKPAQAAKPEGEMRWALYVTLAPLWFDPGEVAGFITPFWVLYALHDGLVKPMPGNIMTPSLAESWTVSSDQRVYEFKLREGLKFHNGDPFTAEDVKFSFYRSKSARVLKEKVREVEIVGPYRVRFHLHEPFPDFMAFYGTLATGASWVVPKKYVEQVGNEGFKKQPVGLGPYKFVSNTPGVELVMEAFEGYWRKTPHVKRLVFKSVPEATTRAAMLKKGEVDVAYLLDAPTALEIKRDPDLRLAFSGAIGIHFVEFFDQWDPKSPWHDRRVRLAANYAIDRRSLNEAETLGASRLTGGMVPRKFEFALALEPYPHDPAKAKQLLAEAGYPNGLDAGDFAAIPGFPTVAEAVVNDLNAAGIRVRLRAMERAAFYAEWREKKLRSLFLTAVGNSGNAASRVESFIQSKGAYTYGGYPDIDDLFAQQNGERDIQKREALLHRIQQLTIDRVMHAPVMDLRALMGVGPRIARHTITDIWMSPWPAYEDIELKD